jgi:hypothetical protein
LRYVFGVYHTSAVLAAEPIITYPNITKVSRNCLALVDPKNVSQKGQLLECMTRIGEERKIENM